MDTDTIYHRMQHQPGPGLGQGRGLGRPYRGIVEETPALWVQWIAAAYRRMGKDVPDEIFVDGMPVRLVYTQLTFGKRYYFICPLCGHRRETLYFLRRDFGCRKCLHLGYRSAVQRKTSIWACLDRVFRGGELTRRSRRREGDAELEDLVQEMREYLAGQIDVMVARLGGGEKEE